MKALQKTIRTSAGKITLYHLPSLPKLGLPDPARLPFSIKILLENAIRNCDGYQVTMEDVKKIAQWTPRNLPQTEIAFKPARVILQDFTGVPCVVDLAAMRSALNQLGGDFKKINPQIPCDLVIDHSLQVDAYGSKKAFSINLKKEFQRNRERYMLLKWAQKVFKNFTVVPPATGIIHQVNLEYLAKGVLTRDYEGETIAFPDTVFGTDSHTTMINSLGIVGWGVGGIEAEAVMLGEASSMLLPDVIGVRFLGKLSEGVTATDLVLTITQLLRKRGVVGKFVEFFGPGVKHLSLPDRAVLSNMAPEYGATIGLFPVDKETLNYYELTGRSRAHVSMMERYFKEQGMFVDSKSLPPEFSDVLEVNLAAIEPCVAGPKRPQDRISLKTLKENFAATLLAPVKDRGFGLEAEDFSRSSRISKNEILTQGSVVIAAITSCTNTSNPDLLIAAGLLAKKAVERGLKVPSYVKTSFAPGSQVVTDYLKKAGLLKYLEKLGFHIVGYGCTTCIGNSGPLPDNVSKAIQKDHLVVSSVLSGNRNFEGRINPLVKANFLASPPLVVAFALAGTMGINLDSEPIAKGKRGKPIFLKDIWPTTDEIRRFTKKSVSAKAFTESYRKVYNGDKLWNAIKPKNSDLYEWNFKSTYIQEPPFFKKMSLTAAPVQPIKGARVLAILGDSITTDHISPAGSIASKSPAGKYLQSQGVKPEDFNSYGARRGNDQVMTRGTFANIRLRNFLAHGKEGSWTTVFPAEKEMSIFDAAQAYQRSKTPLIVFAGKEYGSGSSRDWAAKGTALLGVRAVIAQSFERIHRSNLAGMGILPMQFLQDESAPMLKLKGNELFDFIGIDQNIRPRQEIQVIATSPEGLKTDFKVLCRLDTPVEIEYFLNGGILPTVLRKLAKTSSSS